MYKKSIHDCFSFGRCFLDYFGFIDNYSILVVSICSLTSAFNKSIMMDDGTLMVSYEPLAELPNFFRSIISNVASREENVYFMLSEMERLGKHLLDIFPGDTKSKRGR